MDEAIVKSEECVSNDGDSVSEDVGDGSLDCLNNSALEEDLSHGSEVRPDVSIDLDVDVTTVNVNHHVVGLNSGKGPAIVHLSGEGNAKAEVDCVHLDVSMTFGNKDGLFVAEFAGVENT